MHFVFKVDKKKRKRGRHLKKRQNFWHHLQEWLWPTIGHAALFRFAEIRLKRAKGSAYYVAMGVAIGVFVSFTPYLGLHSSVAILLAVLLRASPVVSFLSTLAGNPWTLPVIWMSTLRMGNWMLGRAGEEAVHELPENFNLSAVWENLSFYFDAYLWPMTVSSIPLGIVCGGLCYMLVYYNILYYRKRRAERIRAQRKKWLALKASAGVKKVKGAINKVQDVAGHIKEVRAQKKEEAEQVRLASEQHAEDVIHAFETEEAYVALNSKEVVQKKGKKDD